VSSGRKVRGEGGPYRFQNVLKMTTQGVWRNLRELWGASAFCVFWTKGGPGREGCSNASVQLLQRSTKKKMRLLKCLVMTPSKRGRCLQSRTLTRFFLGKVAATPSQRSVRRLRLLFSLRTSPPRSVCAISFVLKETACGKCQALFQRRAVHDHEKKSKHGWVIGPERLEAFLVSQVHGASRTPPHSTRAGVRKFVRGLGGTSLVGRS